MLVLWFRPPLPMLIDQTLKRGRYAAVFYGPLCLFVFFSLFFIVFFNIGYYYIKLNYKLEFSFIRQIQFAYEFQNLISMG